MLFKRHLSPFRVYLVLLFFLSCISLEGLNSLKFINDIAYVIVNFIFIYLAIYHFRKSLFFIFFLIGLFFDIILYNEIGPHLLAFLIILLILNQFNKFLINFTRNKVFLFFVFMYLLVLIIKEISLMFLLNYIINYTNILYYLFISSIISLPIFYIFDKIDKIKK